MEVEIKHAQRIWRGYLSRELLAPLVVPVANLRDSVVSWSLAGASEGFVEDPVSRIAFDGRFPGSAHRETRAA